MSLRSVTNDNFIIIDMTGQPEVIGEVDFPSALAILHEKAIYLHGGEQYHVEHLDLRALSVRRKWMWITTRMRCDIQVRCWRWRESRGPLWTRTPERDSATDSDDDSIHLADLGCSARLQEAGAVGFHISGRMGMCWCDRKWWVSRK